MKRFLLVLMIISSLNLISQNSSEATIERPTDFELLSSPDSTGKRAPILNPPRYGDKNDTNQKTGAYQIKIPYPIIFIHGLSSKSDTWYNLGNFMYSNYTFYWGGRFDYCLNYDGNNYIANKNFWPATGADLAVFSGSWTVGEYYHVNFDVGTNGSYNPNGNTYEVLSNQSAVAKQGRALRDAISRVLALTGRDKVILVGHSMGGLCAREYLQNSSNWQADGRHHVAKLVTTGTPHGGSNASMSSLNSIFAGIDSKSEAVRDLRESYFYSGNPGVFLFGGVESLTYMDDILSAYFYNPDVNCNGITGETVTGLNAKSIDYNIDYACIIGTANPLNGGDYVVDDQNANLNNYKTSITTNTFSIGVSHTALTQQMYENMQGLDEPNEYYSAYNIGFDTSYTAFTTMQPIGGYSFDYDDFRFVVGANSIVTVNVSNIQLSNLMVRILDASFNPIGTSVSSGGFSTISYTQAINAGTYYLEIYGTPTTSSYLYPYKFILSKTLSGIGVNEITLNESNISIYPNPTNSILNIESQYFGNKVGYEVINSIGQTLLSSNLSSNKTQVDVSNLACGVYLLKIHSDKSTVYKKFIKE